MKNEEIANILKLDNQICFPLYAASRLIVQSYEHVLEKFELTYPQYLVLLVLWEKEGLSVKEIGDKLLLDSGTLTPLLKKLEALGLVKRQRAVDDEREVRNYLSLKGKNLKPKVAAMTFNLFCRSELRLDESLSLRHSLGGLSKKLIKLRRAQASDRTRP